MTFPVNTLGRPTEGPVFSSWNWDRYRKAWELAVKRAKLVDSHWHDLRHTFASWAVQRGASLPEVKDLLGHATLAMTLRHAHPAPEHLRRAVSTLDQMLRPQSTTGAQIPATEPQLSCK